MFFIYFIRDALATFRTTQAITQKINQITHKKADLGEPTKQSQGYWGNSKALLYRDFASNQVDLGYLSDNATQTIRQTEMSFVKSVDLATIQQAVRQLLSDNYSAEIEQNIEQVFSYSSDRQNFKINNLEGVIQRNPQNRIYIGFAE